MKTIHQTSSGRGCLAVAALLAIVSGTAFAGPKTLNLPPETVSYKQAPGVQIATTHCMTCHSADYVQYQPPTTPRATWEAEIKKMKHTFGATIPDDQIAPLAEYLAKNYGNEQGK